MVDLKIDKITNCLEDIFGREYETIFKKVTKKLVKKDYIGWNFDWSKTQDNGYIVYELLLKGANIVQGRISLKEAGNVIEIDIVESAPWNIGTNNGYNGVGAHLFAIACKISFDTGCDGFVAFVSKSSLKDYYQDKLGAEVLFGNRMIINTESAKILVEKYFGNKE